MNRWTRHFYQPSVPLGQDGRRVTGSPEHIRLSREAACEGMVLLKNEKEILPFARGTRLALFGKGSVDYVKGGGGSGDVTVAYSRSLQDGLEYKEKEGSVQVFAPLGEFYRKNVRDQYENGAVPGKTTEPEIPGELLDQAKCWADAAVISICRYSLEDADREGIPGDGDFYLTKEEQEMIKAVTSRFEKVVAVLNVGGMVDTSWFKDTDEIPGVLLAWQGGMEGGLAAADILCGDVNPSGKLTDTFAHSFADYPSSAHFNDSKDYVEYTEDIYVGYRYFETIPGAGEKVNYPFGFGLSYTTFDLQILEAGEKDGRIFAEVCVRNTGKSAGKEVVQMYAGAPQGKLGKPSKTLMAFEKTRLLQPGDVQTLRLSFPIDGMASYDDLGKIAKSSYVLEAGSYVFWIGNSVRNVEKADFTYIVEEDRTVETLSEKCAPCALTRRLLADGTYEELPLRENTYRSDEIEMTEIECVDGIFPRERFVDYRDRAKKEVNFTLQDVTEGKASVREFLAQLEDEQVMDLLSGQPNTGVADTFGVGNLREYGVPNIMTADGPAGVRIEPDRGVTTTAWPCATLLACTWNPQLAEQIGRAGALEIKENNMGIWLTPAMNIHRSPLCGRNFEYYSEDPLVTGKMGAAMIRGIQSEHIGTAMKHFCCNNKETNRRGSDSRVSERALREIYLKGFEIAVKESQPWMVMSSYNWLNGYPTSCSRELLTGILREEWGFEGAVVTDWWNLKPHYQEVKAGNDLKMGCGYPENLKKALEKGLLTREEMDICAERLLKLILKFD